MLKQSKTKLAGSRYRDATKYKLDASPSTRPSEL